MTINKNNFYKIFILTLLFCIPIIINNSFYIDDNVRVLTGNADWSWVGRPFADWLFYLLSSGFKIDDFSPISLILGLAFFSVIISNILKEDKTWLEILPYSFIVVNPFFLQNLSYKFDSLPMLLALSLSLYAFYYENINIYKKCIVIGVLLILTLGLYQPCINIFLMLIACNCLYKIREGIKSKIIILYSFLYIIANLIYLVLSKLVGTDLSRGGLSPLNELINNAFADIIMLYKVSHFLIGTSGFIILLACVVYLWFISVAEQQKKIDFLLTIFSPLIIFLSIWGPMIFLKELISLPREWCSIGVLLFVLSKAISDKIKNTEYLNVILYSILLLLSANLANMIKIQDDFNKQIYSSIFFNITNDPMLYNVREIEINGNVPVSKLFSEKLKRHPYFYSLTMATPEWITRVKLIKMGLKQVKINFEPKDDKRLEQIKKDSLLPKVNNQFYMIYKDKEGIVSIWFK